MIARLGKYLLIERINEGGMADVYLAKTFGWGGANQVVAAKCIKPDVYADPSFVSMFIDEAKLAVQLTHDNIAQTFELGRIGPDYFIAMEHVLGRDLRAIINRAQARGVEMPLALALDIIGQMLEGLDYAHRKTDMTGLPLQIVHRDVSPQNVLVSYDGDVKLIDFGIAKAASHATHSQGDVLRGKHGYMSPEQVRGHAVDARSDIFAAGALLYELLTRERLFSGASDFSIIEKVRYAEVYPPRVILPALPVDVEALVLKALEREPGERFASASDMQDALVHVMLRTCGKPTRRDLASFMQSLFAEERQRDLVLLDRAMQIATMPMDVPTLAEERTATRVMEAHGGGAELGEGAEEPVLEAAPSVSSFATGAPRPAAPLMATAVMAIPGGGRARGVFEGDTDIIRAERLRSLREDGDASGDDGDGDADGDTTDRREAPTRREDTFVDRRVPDRLATEVERPAPLMGRPTELRVAYPRRRLARDLVIVGAALLLGLAIISATWVLTRRAPPPTYGRVVITSHPAGASVLIDGVQVGATPFSSSRVLSGRRQIVLRRDGYHEARELVSVSPTDVVNVNVSLRPRP